MTRFGSRRWKPTTGKSVGKPRLYAGIEFCRSVSRARGDTTADGRVSAAGAAMLYLAAYDALRGVTAPEGRDAALLADIRTGAGIN